MNELYEAIEAKIKASGFDGVLINITNPCDIVTRELALHLGLPRGRVFGTGTGLDTSRLLSALARQTGLDHKVVVPLRVVLLDFGEIFKLYCHIL